MQAQSNTKKKTWCFVSKLNLKPHFCGNTNILKVTHLPIKPLSSHHAQAQLGVVVVLTVIICKWSRPMLFCIRQEKSVTSAMVAYIEQWFGGLVSWNELLWRMVLCDVSLSVIVVCWENRLVGGEEGKKKKTETTDLIVLTFSLSIFIFLLTVLLLSSALCTCWLSSPSVFLFVVCLPAGRPLENAFHGVVSLPVCHVTFMFLFVSPVALTAWLSVSRVFLSVVKTFHWLTVTKWGLKC